jgi:membrane-bound lytic murein transglycosylase B
MVVKHQFRRRTENLFAHAQHRPAVIEAISRPATIKPWLEYRAAFVNPKRVRLGLEFWHKYRHTLRRAEQKYGVPQEIIIAVIGVETIYGQNAGNSVKDATTLAFDYPRRGFSRRAGKYLLLAREQQFDCWPSAPGMPARWASTVHAGSDRNHAVDFNGNRKLICCAKTVMR